MVLKDDDKLKKISQIQRKVLESNLINENDDKYIKMKGSTLKDLFDMINLTQSGVEKIKRLSDGTI